MLSLIVPVYKNQENLPRLLNAMVALDQSFMGDFEVIFVVDASPDDCLNTLSHELPLMPFRSRLLSLSRNFGSFAAITAGMHHVRGDFTAVMAADLQEPPELILQFWNVLKNDEADIVFGYRISRSDPWLSKWFSNTYWSLYRRFVIRTMPEGGVDVFGCTREVCERLLALNESPNNLIGLLFWLGFRRAFIPYERRQRIEGRSAWTMAKKLEYGFEGIFNFTDLPIRLLLYTGVGGIIIALFCSAVVLAAKLFGDIRVPGYTPIVLAIMFFGALTSLGFGIVGQYLWLTLQNSRARPGFIVSHSFEFPGRPSPGR